MNDVDRYLIREYTDPEYRRYQIASEAERTPGWLSHWRRFFHGLQAVSPVPIPGGETSLAPSVRVWLVGAGEPNLHCVEGTLWLTKTGDNRDYILSAGQNRRLEAGHWVVQALVPSRFRVYQTTSEEVSHGQANLLSAF